MPLDRVHFEMKIKNEEITTEDILGHWKQGKSTLDWRPLTIKAKREWLKACLSWTGLPNSKIKAHDYLLDATQVKSDLDFYCLLGEIFFGYRGYFGQDSHGLDDCFTEIFMRTKDKETVEAGTKLKITNAGQLKEVLQDNFAHVINSFADRGIILELD